MSEMEIHIARKPRGKSHYIRTERYLEVDGTWYIELIDDAAMCGTPIWEFETFFRVHELTCERCKKIDEGQIFLKSLIHHDRHSRYGSHHIPPGWKEINTDTLIEHSIYHRRSCIIEVP